jgi:hypothetical protein
VPDHLVSRITQVSLSDKTKPLAWRASDYSRHFASLQVGFLCYFGKAYLRNIGMQQSRGGKIQFE